MRRLELSVQTQLILSPATITKEAMDRRLESLQTRRKAMSAVVRRAATGSGIASGSAAAVTIIPIWGILGRGWSEIEKYYYDACDVDDLIAEIESTPTGSTVVLYFRSPGGIITGIPEMAAYLRAAGKRRRFIAFTDDLCASAAYWLASQCELIITTPTADVGSIGVYIAFYDWTKFLESQGINLELFKAGTMKAMGMPGNPLSDEESNLLQSRVDTGYALFTGDVLRNRDIADADMQGQCFSGRDAVSNNLADAQVASFNDFLAALVAGKFDN